MKFKLSGVLCSKLDIIDDAEQTPGHSREMTRFRHQCYEPIVKAMIKLRPAHMHTDLSEVWNTVNDILVKQSYKIVKSEFHTDERGAWMDAEFEITSTED
jgi:hypothetical protein